MMVVSGVISHHGRRPCIFTVPLEVKEERSRSHLIVHWKWSRNKFWWYIVWYSSIVWADFVFFSYAKLRPTASKPTIICLSLFHSLRFTVCTGYSVCKKWIGRIWVASNLFVYQGGLEWLNVKVDALRSWVQIISPGPLLYVMELRYYFEFIFWYCWTNSHKMPWELLFWSLLPDKNSFKAIMFIHITAYGKARR